MSSFLIFLLKLYILGQLLQFSNAHIYTLEMHHRFSEPVKKWSQVKGKDFQVHNWPVKGSVEYYAVLANHDRLLHGRRLSESDGLLTFSDGNSTYQISSLGFLHYTTVKLGTPGRKFMVALDTGSDLFWVPCDCEKCASLDDPFGASGFELSIYDPNMSSTSKKVACSNSLCAHHSTCLDGSSHCPYSISYISSETSTSGILMDDVLHLKTEDSHQESIEAYVTFGCGQVQTGSFLDVAAPNGLFGLGFEKISVPSILSREGYTADSFSMCFGRDGTGRISFGDKGSVDQEETPFTFNPLHPTYNVTVAQVRVGTNIFDLEFQTLFDSGTSFTYLVDPGYTKILESFHSHIQDKRHPPDARIPFEYCYDMRPDENSSLIPTMRLTMQGGGQFVLYDPMIVISTQNELVYCLAVVRSQDLNIIGQNFMNGYRIVFDREKLVLGWKKFDCYDVEKSAALKPRNSTSVPPAVAVGMRNNSTAKSTGNTKNPAQSSMAFSLSPFYHDSTTIYWLFSRLVFSFLPFVLLLLLLL